MSGRSPRRLFESTGHRNRPYDPRMAEGPDPQAPKWFETPLVRAAIAAVSLSVLAIIVAAVMLLARNAHGSQGSTAGTGSADRDRDRHRTDSDPDGTVERPERTRDPDGVGHAVAHRRACDVKRCEHPDLHPDVRPDPCAKLGPGSPAPSPPSGPHLN